MEPTNLNPVSCFLVIRSKMGVTRKQLTRQPTCRSIANWIQQQHNYRTVSSSARSSWCLQRFCFAFSSESSSFFQPSSPHSGAAISSFENSSDSNSHPNMSRHPSSKPGLDQRGAAVPRILLGAEEYGHVPHILRPTLQPSTLFMWKQFLSQVIFVEHESRHLKGQIRN